MNHLTSDQVQEYVDGALSSDVELHLRGCSLCQSRVNAFRTIDRSLRSLPLEEASPKFTERVLRELGLRSTPSFTWLFFRNLAPFLALTFVAGVLILALKVTGKFDSTELGQTSVATQEVYKQVGGGVSTGLQAFNSWVGNYLSFAFAKNTYGLTAFIFIFLGGIALLDKFLIMPMMKKRHGASA
jgi:anti-sigma factor RsiW